MVAISTDEPGKMKEFKESLKAPFTFVPDPDAKIVKLYDLKMPVVTVANRYTFVVAQDGKVTDIKSGSDAIDPGGTITACPLHKEAKEAK